MYLREMKTYICAKIYIQMFITLFKIIKEVEIKCPSIENGKNKICTTHMMVIIQPYK